MSLIIAVCIKMRLVGEKRSKSFDKRRFMPIYICPAGERLAFHYTNIENALTLRRYWTNVCKACAISDKCTKSGYLLKRQGWGDG